MGKARETSNVSHRMLVSISLEIFHDCIKSLDHVPLHNCLQSRAIHFHRLTLDTHDNLDIAPGNNHLNHFYLKVLKHPDSIINPNLKKPFNVPIVIL